jgi:phosphoribosylformimino-5-aminoimidazole carboxamide ribotide isomerase
MRLYPAIDLRGGRAVQLVGGVPGSERVSLPDPIAVAERWIEVGFRALHLVDLDAALGEGDNQDAIGALLAAAQVPVQVGGGVRDDAAAARLLDAGAARLIAGTRAVEDPAWIAALAERWPGRVCVAADTRDGRVVTRGWTAGGRLEPAALLARLDTLPLAAVLVTDVSREGQLRGIDADHFATLAAATRHPLVAAGGITSLDDLRALDAAGVAGAVVGMALDTGAIDARAALQEFDG